LPHAFQALASSIPDSFPNLETLLLYAKPLTSRFADVAGPDLSACQPRVPDIIQLAKFCVRRFDWQPTIPGGVRHKFHDSLWDGICLQMLRQVCFLFHFVEILLT
jgi:holliday junction resolvase YEN1